MMSFLGSIPWRLNIMHRWILSVQRSDQGGKSVTEYPFFFRLLSTVLIDVWSISGEVAKIITWFLVIEMIVITITNATRAAPANRGDISLCFTSIVSEIYTCTVMTYPVRLQDCPVYEWKITSRSLNCWY